MEMHTTLEASIMHDDIYSSCLLAYFINDVNLLTLMFCFFIIKFCCCHCHKLILIAIACLFVLGALLYNIKGTQLAYAFSYFSLDLYNDQWNALITPAHDIVHVALGRILLLQSE